MEANQLPVPDDLVLEGYSGYPEWGHKAARYYLDRGLDLTAVLCFNDLLAYGLVQEFAQAGVEVPERISVIGFDDIPNSQYITPRGLTTLRQPIVKIGQRALEMTVDLINQRIQPGAHVRIPLELVIRGTTAPASHLDCEGQRIQPR